MEQRRGGKIKEGRQTERDSCPNEKTPLVMQAVVDEAKPDEDGRAKNDLQGEFSHGFEVNIHGAVYNSSQFFIRQARQIPQPSDWC